MQRTSFDWYEAFCDSLPQPVYCSGCKKYTLPLHLCPQDDYIDWVTELATTPRNTKDSPDV